MNRIKALLAVAGIVLITTFVAAQGVSLPSPAYRIIYTAATPEGAIAKPIGWVAIRTDNGAVYAKTSGTGNTGWTQLAAGSGLIAADLDTCAEFAAIMGGETGTCGSIVLSVSPTLITPILGVAVATTLDTGQGANELFDMDQNVLTTSNVQFAILTLTGAAVFPDGVRQTFNPNATTPGFSVGSIAGDPSTPSNGDCWYDSTANEFTCRINGANVALGGAGSVTNWNDIGDATADGLIDLSTRLTQWISSRSAAGTVFEVLNSTADLTADVILWRVAFNDGADANGIFARFVDDADGTPRTVFEVSQTAAILAVDLTVPDEAFNDTGWNGDLTVPTKNAIRDYLAANFATIGADPGADYIVFWDDSDGALDYLTTNACLTISGNTLTIATTCDAIINTLSLEAAGVKLSGDDDGALTFLGLGNGSDEDLTMNLDDTPNTVVWSSSTGLNVWDFGGFTLLNTLFNAEDTGNTLTLPLYALFMPAAAQNGVASLGFNTTTSGAATPTFSGTTVVVPLVSYADSGTQEVQFSFKLPSDINLSLAVELLIEWRTSATTGNGVWQASGVCMADAEVIPTAYSSSPDEVIDAAKGTTLQANNATLTLTGGANKPLVTCAAGEHLFLRLFRDPTHASDTIAAAAEIIGLNLRYRSAK